jgi:hypothetical protein
MTIDEQNGFIGRMMADCDAAIAALRGASPTSDRTVMECEVSEVDFLRSSR